jgi:hypothetical protein
MTLARSGVELAITPSGSNSASPDASASGRMAGPSCSSRTNSSPEATPNTRAEPSWLTVATNLPSGLNATALIPASWSSRAAKRARRKPHRR